jgi:NADH:ubiquinone oxidoreductase subunit 2 (subunit N)
MFKFYLSLKLENAIGPYIYKIKLDFFMNNNNLNILEHFIAFSSSFSDAILILSFLTGLICIELLGPKNLFQSTTNISIFYAFNVFVTIMVSTNNLLIMFISFELIFLPTIFFVYKLGYSKKIDKAIEALFY